MRRLPIFYSALLLTGVNLLLRMVGTTFQVYLSGRIGPAGIGLLQLTLSVGNLAMVAGIGGIRTAAMYLTAEELGRGYPRRVGPVLSSCFLYSILCSTAAAITLYCAAPLLARQWIGDSRTLPALRLLASFLPLTCLCGVMTGYFTAAKRIGMLAAVEVCEQLCALTVTMTALTFWAGTDPGRACIAVVGGSCAGSILTLGVLLVLRYREAPGKDDPIPVRSRLLQAAVPLAGADILRSGISTAENLMVPKRLALFAGTRDPLAAFGMVSGMVFPIMMFPACILFALAELLIPELAGCRAAGKDIRIRHLVQRGLKTALLYGTLFGGLIYLLAEPLCMRLYRSQEAGRFLRLYAVMIPFLYCDAITDAMTKGLGQQKACVRYNILTSAMDVAFLFLLLPKWGMNGYFFSFLVTHLLNFCLSLRRLIRISGVRIPFYIPALTAAAGIAAVWGTSHASSAILIGISYPAALASLLFLFRILSGEDIRWAKGLILRHAAP